MATQALDGLRVAHLTTVDSSLKYLLEPQLRAALDAGAEVIGISAPGPFVADLERLGVRHVPLPSSTRGADLKADVAAAGELWQALRRERPHILHTHNPKPSVYGRVLGRLAGVPVVVNTNHGLYATDGDPLALRALVLGLEAVASRFSHAELQQSPEDHRLLTGAHLVPRHRTTLLGNGIDLDRFDPDRFTAADRRAVRAELGIGDHQVVVATVGRLVVEKGVPELFAAARHLGGDVVVVVVGPDDPDKADAIDPATLDAARARGVRLLGLRDDIDRLYAAMDVFVLASHREGFPRAAMEAAAMGLPVVATDIRGCRQVVEHGRTGLLFPKGDTGALVAALRALAADTDARRELGQAGRCKARAEFDQRRVVQTVLDTYARLVAQRGVVVTPQVVAPA